MMLNDRLFPIRKNLWDFLSVASLHKGNLYVNRSRHPAFDFSQATKCLWIDALCIDQSNILERNHQVQQMGEIYSHAQQVIAWIGHDRQTATSFALGGPYIERMDFLWDNEYWHRAWITQELVLAKEIFMVTADRAIHYSHLLRVVQESVSKNSDQSESRYRALFDVQKSKDLSHTLIDNFMRFKDRRCSDLRDRVYSLLSVSSDGARITVDYGASVTDLALSLHPPYNPLCVCDVATLETVCEILGGGLSWSNLPDFTWHVSATLPRNHEYHCCKTGMRAIDRDRKFLVDLGLKWPEERVYCLQCPHSLRRVMDHIILGHSNTSDDVEVFCIAQGRLRRAPKCMKLQSLDTAGNAVFSAPVVMMYEKIADASSDYTHDNRWQLRQMKKALYPDSIAEASQE
jgi:hypothetical protein